MIEKIKAQLATYRLAIHRGNQTARNYVEHVEWLLAQLEAAEKNYKRERQWNSDCDTYEDME